MRLAAPINTLDLLYDMRINMEKGPIGPFEAVSLGRTEVLVAQLLDKFEKLIREEREENFGG